MRDLRFRWSVGICTAIILLACGFVLLMGTRPTAARPQSGMMPSVGTAEIGGVVASPKGPEAGVWVIAETTDLPTKFRKIVVTDDQGRYMLPELPKANYKIWVRGYGLIDSIPVQAMPGKTLDLTAVIAPNERAAAQYYPADYWYSLAKVPDKSEFPGTGPQGNGINPMLKTQADWIWQMKSGCETCHQIGDKASREVEPQLGTFTNTAAAWDYRTKVGQDGAGMSATMNNYGHDRGVGMLADWTDRIAKGELPPAPPRPQGIERNIVVTLWEWGGPTTFTHDELTTNKRKPTENANGPIYGVDWGNDAFLIVDPVEHTASMLRVPTAEEGIATAKPQSMMEPSPYWGNELYWADPANPNHMAMDSKGRVWITSRFRPEMKEPDYCKEGSDLYWAKLAPLNLSFDAWLYHPQIDELADLARAFPDTRIVLNHVGGPLTIGSYAGKRGRSVASVPDTASMRPDACPRVPGSVGSSVYGSSMEDRQQTGEAIEPGVSATARPGIGRRFHEGGVLSRRSEALWLL